MAEEQRELRTWRQRIAAPLTVSKGPGEEIQTEEVPNKTTKPQNADSLRVGLFEKSPTKPQQNNHGPRLVSLGENRWAEAEWARELCVMCLDPLAPGDLVTCVAHQGRLPGLAGQKCLIAGCLVPTVDIAYCGGHRRMADAGTLWPNDGRGCDA